MGNLTGFELLAGLAAVFCIAAFAWRLAQYNRLVRPVDQARPKGSLRSGILYAYTLGMAPWSKESTRMHTAAYLRGVAFHLGIFLGLAALAAGPWASALPAWLAAAVAILAGLGALLGLVGIRMRLVEPNLKALSTPDDYFAAALVSLFLGACSLAYVNFNLMPVFYLTSAVMLAYAPLGKIRHCIYFAYSRLFYGKFIGSHAVLPHQQQTGR